MISDSDKKENSHFFNKKLLFKTFGIILLIVIFLLIVADFKIYQKKQELNAQIDALQKRIEDTKKSSQTLKNEIANADNADYLEKLAYEQLGQQKPGETEYIFIAPPEKTKAIQAQQNFWSKFSGWLSGAGQWIKSKF